MERVTSLKLNLFYSQQSLRSSLGSSVTCMIILWVTEYRDEGKIRVSISSRKPFAWLDTQILIRMTQNSKAVICAFIVSSICSVICAVSQQQAVNTKFHSYSLGSYGQYNMRYKSIEASSKVRDWGMRWFRKLHLRIPMRFQIWCSIMVLGHGAYAVILSPSSCLFRKICPILSDRIRCVHSKHLYCEAADHIMLSGPIHSGALRLFNSIISIYLQLRPLSLMYHSTDYFLHFLLFSISHDNDIPRRRSLQSFVFTALEEMQTNSARTFQNLRKVAMNRMQLIY